MVEHVVEGVVAVAPVNPTIVWVIEDDIKEQRIVFEDGNFLHLPDRSVLLQVGFYLDVAFRTYSFQLLIVWHLDILFGAQPGSF
jgi:hypothetical protein